MIRAPFFLALLIGSLPAFAAENGPVPIDHETLTVVGWNKDCSVAVSHLSYPVVGAAIAGDPVITRLGPLTIAPGEEKASADWRVDWDGARSWQQDVYKTARADLASEGYSQPGWQETIRPALVIEDRDLPRLILSTDTFRTTSTDFPKAFPTRWRIARVHYSPQDSACALFVFEDRTARPGKPAFDFRLVRVGNPGIRADRALAHVTNGLLLLERGDRPGALEETLIAVQMAPDSASSHYHYARQLALNGRGDAAMDELASAVALDKTYKRKARDEPDFEDVAWMPRFKDLTR
jgi:hypothetical protein